MSVGTKSTVEDIGFTQEISPENSYDIVINGGGIVGFSFLASIQSSPFLRNKRVLLIEQQNPPKVSDGDQQTEDRVFSNRVSALTESSKQFFEKLGVWNALSPFAKTTNAMYVWSEHYQNGIKFQPSSDVDNVCYIAENNRMIKALYEKINSTSKAHFTEVAYGTIVTDVVQRPIKNSGDSSSVVLKISKKSEDTEPDFKLIQAKLLIGCDGFKSLVRSKSTLPYFEHDLQQMGIVATLEIDSPYPDNDVAFQRFVGNELVIALLPLDERHSSLVLSVPKRNVDSWIKLNDEEFVHRLNIELIKETKVRSSLDKLAATLNQNNFHNPFETKFLPNILSVAPKSIAPFPLGFGTTVPFMVGNIQPKVSLLKAMNRDRVNTVIIGINFLFNFVLFKLRFLFQVMPHIVFIL